MIRSAPRAARSALRLVASRLACSPFHGFAPLAASLLRVVVVRFAASRLRRFAASPLCGCAARVVVVRFAASRLCRSLRSPLCFIGSRAARARKFSFIGFARARAYSTRILVEKWSKMAKNGQKCIFDPIFGFYARKSTFEFLVKFSIFLRFWAFLGSSQDSFKDEKE